MKFSGRQCRLVKLQRPPPEIRIFLPTRSVRSSTTTRRPRLPASMAHIRPAAPAPKTIASNSSAMDPDRNCCCRDHRMLAEVVRVVSENQLMKYFHHRDTEAHIGNSPSCQ